MKLSRPKLTDTIIEASGGQEMNVKFRGFGAPAEYRFIKQGETVKQAIRRMMSARIKLHSQKERRSFPTVGEFETTLEYFEMYQKMNSNPYNADNPCLEFTNLSRAGYAQNEGQDVIDESYMLAGVCETLKNECAGIL